MEGRVLPPHTIVFMERKKGRREEGEQFTFSGLSLLTILELTRMAHCIVSTVQMNTYDLCDWPINFF